MTRVAAVDCGTNSIRLLIADLAADGTQSDVVRRTTIVRLGQDVDRTGVLAPAALERTRVALVGYAAQVRELGAHRVRMVATSATRDAANRADFVSMVRATLDTDPEVVSGEEEAALSFAGATRGLTGVATPYLVVDIGGGSTEFVLGDGQVEAAMSVDIGCVRLTERHLRDDPPTPDQVAAADADIEAALARVREVVPLHRAASVIGLAGSVTTVAALALALPAYDAALIHRARIAKTDVDSITRSLLRATRAERVALPVMHPGRADVIGAGALVLLRVLTATGATEVAASEADILDGIAWSLADPGSLSLADPGSLR